MLDAGLSLAEAHEILDEVEMRIFAEFPGCELLLHPDPEGYHAGPREFGKA